MAALQQLPKDKGAKDLTSATGSLHLQGEMAAEAATSKLQTPDTPQNRRAIGCAGTQRAGSQKPELPERVKGVRMMTQEGCSRQRSQLGRKLRCLGR